MKTEHKDLQAPIPTLRRLCIAIGVLGFLGFVLDIIQIIRESSLSYQYIGIAGSSSLILQVFAVLFITDLWAMLQYGHILRQQHRPLLTQRRDLNIFFRVFFILEILIVTYLPITTFLDQIRRTSRFNRYNDTNLLYRRLSTCYEQQAQAQRDKVLFIYNCPYSEDTLGTCLTIRTRSLVGFCLILLALVEMMLYTRSNLGTEAWVERNIEILFDNTQNRQQPLSKDGMSVEGEGSTLFAREEKEMADHVFYLT